MKRGFTIVEILVCLAIIGILVSLFVPVVGVISNPTEANVPVRHNNEFAQVRTINHNNHRYLKFECWNQYASDYGYMIIHDPDCPCGWLKHNLNQ